MSKLDDLIKQETKMLVLVRAANKEGIEAKAVVGRLEARYSSLLSEYQKAMDATKNEILCMKAVAEKELLEHERFFGHDISR